MFVLTNWDIPWEADPLRFGPDAETRKKFHDFFISELVQRGAVWVEVSGSLPERLQAVGAALARLGLPPPNAQPHSH